MVFEKTSLETLAAHYPGAPVRLRHQLCGDDLFKLDRLLDLASALPEECVEYNAGALPLHQDPDKTPMNGLSAEETIRRIAEHQSWMVLKRIEQDREYADLLNRCLDEVAALAAPATGPMYKREGFIFLSSPGSVTPFHMDPEHNILMQISGEKTFHIFPVDDVAIVSDAQHEAYHLPGAHRNLPYGEEFEARASAHTLEPGDALYVPVKAPHWVGNGDAVSVSLSITWRSRASDDEAHLRRANGWLRGRGAKPPQPGAALMRDRALIAGQRLRERFLKGSGAG